MFVVAGADKFVRHDTETDAFRDYGLPAPEVFVSVIGVVELAGGALLLLGLATRWAALTLAGVMAGAVVVAGLIEGETFSLTVAPAMLATLLGILAVGPGRRSLDGR